MDPDLSPDGRTLVAVQDRAGQRNLVLVRLPRPRSALRRASPTRLRSPSFVEVAPERFARRRKRREGGKPDPAWFCEFCVECRTVWPRSAFLSPQKGGHFERCRICRIVGQIE